MKPLVRISLLIALLVLISPLSAYANEKNQCNVPYTNEQLLELDQKIKALEQDAAKYDTMDFGSRATTVTLGTNTTLWGASSGAVYESDSESRTDAEYGTDSNGWLDARCEFMYPGAAGDGYAWGWLGQYITVSGSGSRSCTITISGDYEGVLSGGYDVINNNAGFDIKVQVYDVTSGFSLVKEKTVDSQNFYFLCLPNNFDGTIGSNNSMTCNLQAGHNYLVRVRLYTHASAELDLKQEDLSESDEKIMIIIQFTS